jgi:hypothetical protein
MMLPEKCDRCGEKDAHLRKISYQWGGPAWICAFCYADQVVKDHDRSPYHPHEVFE